MKVLAKGRGGGEVRSASWIRCGGKAPGIRRGGRGWGRWRSWSNRVSGFCCSRWVLRFRFVFFLRMSRLYTNAMNLSGCLDRGG